MHSLHINLYYHNMMFLLRKYTHFTWIKNLKKLKNFNFNFLSKAPPPKGGGLRQIKFFSFSETLLNIHVFQKLGIIPVSWHETENRGVGALDNCFHQVLSSHWFRGDTCDQMLGSDWRRFHFLTWNWKRWKGDGMVGDLREGSWHFLV